MIEKKRRRPFLLLTVATLLLHVANVEAQAPGPVSPMPTDPPPTIGPAPTEPTSAPEPAHESAAAPAHESAAAPTPTPGEAVEPPVNATIGAAVAAAVSAQEPVAVAPAESAEDAEPGWWTDHPVALESIRWSPGDGLTFASEDGLFSLALRLRAQFLYEVEMPYDRAEGERGDVEQNLLIRRARVVFAGNMWGAKTKYKVELAVAPADIGMRSLPGTDNPPMTNGDNYVSRSLLLDWYVEFKQLRDLNVRVGQYKVSYSRERVISSGDLQFVDRSLLNQEFTVDRDVGIELRSRDLFGWDKRLRYAVGIYNGDGHSQYELDTFSPMYLARLEFLPLGDFEDYEQSDLERSDKPGLSIGVAYARIQDAAGSRGILGSRFADGGTTDYNNVTADLMFKYAGLSIESAYFLRDGTRSAGDAVDDEGMPIAAVAPRAGWGAGAQVGYLLPTTELELAARGNVIRQRGSDSESSLRERNELACAVSYYVARHSYKLQADWTRYWGMGERDAGVELENGFDVVRVQLQAAF